MPTLGLTPKHTHTDTVTDSYNTPTVSQPYVHTHTQYTLMHSYSTPTLTVSHPYILTDTQTHTDTLTQHTYIHSLIPLCTHSHTDTH